MPRTYTFPLAPVWLTHRLWRGGQVRVRGIDLRAHQHNAVASVHSILQIARPRRARDMGVVMRVSKKEGWQ